MAADADERRVTIGALGAELGITSGATTFAVNRLERAGLVRRTRDPDDQRRIFLSLSESGRDLAMRFYSPVRDRSLGVLARFTDAELQIVRRFLGETLTAMEACRSDFELVEHRSQGS
jgi:DNA-binding MarR family transcriptional regulator